MKSGELCKLAGSLGSEQKNGKGCSHRIDLSRPKIRSTS